MRYSFNNSNNEAMIRFELAYNLRRSNIDFGLEYKYRNKYGKVCIFDVVIMKDDCVIGVIECKKSERPNWESTNQCKKYENSGVPVYLCDGMDRLNDAVDFARKCFENPVRLKIYTKEENPWKVIKQCGIKST